MSVFTILALAMVLDATLGEPDWLWSRLRHPAVLMGQAVTWCDETFNVGPGRKAKGVAVIAALTLGAVLLGLAIRWLPDGGVLEVVIVAILLAQRSLADHVRDVGDALYKGLEPGRDAVAMIVGRDVATLDKNGVARGAIESAAENLSDGVIAPIFWYIIAGLPGIIAYKLINTADSTIGYRTERHAEFGWAAARLDDVVNWVPARLTAALIAISNGSFEAFRVMARDAKLHRSPNAGWPEAAMACTLGTALSGPRSYGGDMRDDPYVYAEGRRDLGANDIWRAVAVNWRSWGLTLAVVVTLSFAWTGEAFLFTSPR